MQYVSVDLETTGLDREQDQILEIAAVVDGGPFGCSDCTVEQLPSFHTRVYWERVSGSPVAMAMNAGLLSKIGFGGAGIQTPAEAAASFEHFLLKYADTYKLPKPRITGAGKNFASFDLQFLKRFAPNAAKLFHHRVIDPAMFFIEPGDTEPPNTETCLQRAGFDSRIKHEALDDARNVVRLVRIGLARLTQAPSVSA